MKKLFKSIILSAVLLMGAAAVAPSVSAAWSGLQNESGYSGRVFTDAATYTAGVYKKRSGGGLTDTNLVQRGSFKTATPLKSFNAKTIRNKTGKGSYVIQLDCYSDSVKMNYIGTFESAKFQIK
ncbi:hypothetical protein P9190_01310 [Bacillus velezensis]|uniref:hypothetical protein n=1 Tax=Bacillus velezensis TaxID=492670 RepID=UPI002DBF11FC|nr:hypothetical protein [Bacillus velezensis]MEC3676882.1 hypothetical protein [Bacillus velezensis]